MSRSDNVRTMVAKFDTAEVVAGHTAFAEHLENTAKLARSLALMISQDAEIAATWLRHRRPKKGRRISLVERVALARRTRGHGRNAADALAEAAKALAKAAGVHEEYQRLEGKAAKSRRT